MRKCSTGNYPVSPYCACDPYASIAGKLWNQVAETFIDCTLEWGDKRCRSDTVRKAWALIIAFMMEKIKAGHLEQVRGESELLGRGMSSVLHFRFDVLSHDHPAA